MIKKNKRIDYSWVENFRYEQLKKSSRNPGLAALMSFFVMGLGQIYAGHIDKGIILVTIHFISVLFSHNIFSGGFIYETLKSSIGSDSTLFLFFIFFVIFIIIWIYNIKEAYYLSIFSSFRDWFEIERVLLPSMGVPKNMLISNNSSMLLLENKTDNKTELYDSECINIEKEDENIVVEPENVINIKKADDVENKKESKKKNKLSYKSTSPLVYMNSNSWKIYWAMVVLIVFLGIFICYSFQKRQNELSFQVAQNFDSYKSNIKNKEILFSDITHQDLTTLVNKPKTEESKENLENLIDERIQLQLALNKNKNENTLKELIPDDNSGKQNNNPSIVSDIISNNNETELNDQIIFIKGNKETTLIKKNTKENNTKNSVILYESLEPKDNDEVELVMVDDSSLQDFDRNLEKNKTINDSNPKIPSVNLVSDSNKEKKEKTEEKKGNSNLEKVDNKKNKKSKANFEIETPEKKAQLEKLKELGASEFYQGNWEAALAYYFELLKHRKNSENFEMIGIIFEKMGKNSDAFEAYENAYKVGLNSAHHLSKLGLLAEKIGNYDSAQKYLEKAIEKNPKRADIILSYARCLNQLGESKAAVQVLAVLRDNTDSYAIKKAAEYEYQKILKSNTISENTIAIEKTN